MSDARSITLALPNGHWNGHSGTACCPAHDDQRPSLSIADGEDGRLLVYCFAGCDFPTVLDALRGRGLVEGRSDWRPPTEDELAQRWAEKQAYVKKRSTQAKRSWDEARPIAGSLAEIYLRVQRGITCPLPPTLRSHPECWHGPTARRMHALVAPVEGADGFAVHRTYIEPDGTKTLLEPDRMMLGPCAGGAVRLLGGHPRLVVAEGIENALSLPSGLLDGPMSLWAALSTSGMAALRLPPLVPGAELVVASDSDDEGAGREVAEALAERAEALGWPVSLLPAPDGKDWNKVLLGRGAA